jgi:hypothetical protein
MILILKLLILVGGGDSDIDTADAPWVMAIIFEIAFAATLGRR